MAAASPRRAPFYLLDVSVNLIGDHAALIKDIKAQLDGQVPAATVIDTLNRALVGAESMDMAKFESRPRSVWSAHVCIVGSHSDQSGCR